MRLAHLLAVTAMACSGLDLSAVEGAPPAEPPRPPPPPPRPAPAPYHAPRRAPELPEADRRALDAAEAKRARKAAKRRSGGAS